MPSTIQQQCGKNDVPVTTRFGMIWKHWKCLAECLLRRSSYENLGSGSRCFLTAVMFDDNGLLSFQKNAGEPYNAVWWATCNLQTVCCTDML